MQMMRVTEKLREQWRRQRVQMVEEREFTQSGRARSAEDIAIVDHEIVVMDTLLALPIGTKFNGMEVGRQVAEQRRAEQATTQPGGQPGGQPGTQSETT